MVKHGLPTSTEWWLQHDWAYIDMADELYVLCQDGWDVSKGVAREVRYAQMLIGSKERIPVRYYEVEDWLGID